MKIDSELDMHLRKCIEDCGREYDGELTYRNVVVIACNYFTRLYGANFKNPRFQEIWTFINNGDLWNYLKDQENEDIKLYSSGLEKMIEFSPGDRSRIIMEGVGWMLKSDLPRTFERVKNSRKKPYFQRLDQCERGLVGVIDFGKDILVVKLTNSDDEVEVSKYLGNKGIGPIVNESGEISIAEEFITDPTLSSFKPPPKPKKSGRVLGNIARRLHKAGIVYNNRFWDHVSIGRDVRIHDLEAAHFGNDFDMDLRIIRNELERRYPTTFQRALNSFEEEYYN